MRPERYEIRLSGSGGQGIILAAVLLAEAAGVHGDRYICQSQSYGPEARGGSSHADIIVSPHPIDYPKATAPDLLLAMNQASCDKYWSSSKEKGILLVDRDLVTALPPRQAIAIPFTEIARRETGKPLSANLVALGAVGYLSGVVSTRSLELALAERGPKGDPALNLALLHVGLQAAKAAKKRLVRPGEGPASMEDL